MKHIFDGFLILITIGLLSCGDPLSNDSANSMSCSVGDHSFEATIGVMANYEDELFTITGSGGVAEQCQLIVQECSGTGTYTISEELSERNTARWTNGLEASEDVYTTMVGQGAGTVNITSFSADEIAGTFSFSAKNTQGSEVQVSNGEFRASLK